MGFRFRKQIKVAKGLKLNLSKSGISTSIGGSGHTINIGKNGVKGTLGIPGTGLSYSKLFSEKNKKDIDSNKNISDSYPPPLPSDNNKKNGCLKIFLIIVAVFFSLVIFGWIISLFA